MAFLLPSGPRKISFGRKRQTASHAPSSLTAVTVGQSSSQALEQTREAAERQCLAQQQQQHQQQPQPQQSPLAQQPALVQQQQTTSFQPPRDQRDANGQAPPPNSSSPASGAPRQLAYPWSTRRLQLSLPTVIPKPGIAPSSSPSPSPFPRYRHSLPAVASQTGELFLFGGIAKNSVRNDLYSLNSREFSATLLQTTGDVPSPRVGHACALVSSILIVWGGDTKSDSRPYVSNTQDDGLYLLNLVTREWTRVTATGPAPVGRYGHAVAMVGARFYVFGGQLGGQFLNDLWVFDLNTLRTKLSVRTKAAWELIMPASNEAPTRRTGHTCITYGDRIIIFGGTDSQYRYNDTWSFDTNTRQWAELNCIGFVPSPREGHAAALVNDVIYIFGGRGVDGSDLGDLAAFRISNQRWYIFQNMGPAPSVRSGHRMAAVGKRVFVLGGESSSGGPSDDSTIIHVLDTKNIKYPELSKASPTDAQGGIAARRPSDSGGQSPQPSPPSQRTMPNGLAQRSTSLTGRSAADVQGRRRAISPPGTRPSVGAKPMNENVQIAVVDADVRRIQTVRNGDSYTDSLDRLLQKLSDSGLDLTGKVKQQGNVAWRQGGHADIYLGNYSLDGHKVAIKRLRFNLHSDFSIAKKITRELRVWFKLRHANILPLKGFITQENLYPALITDWMDHGTVMEYVKNNSPVDKLQLVEGVANGLEYLHQVGIVHADLKCGNILVSTSGVPLLMDFGISHLMQATSTNETATRSEKGTIRWMSPELITYDQVGGVGEDVHTKASDVWAFGMTILELLTELPPFSHLRTDGQVMLALYRNELPRDPDDLDARREEEKILWGMCHKNCWLRDHVDRPSMSILVDALKGIRLACAVD